MMKKRCLLLASLLAAACVPSLTAVAQEEDFTSHIVNAGFEEGPDLESSFTTGNYGTFYAPKGWTVTYNAENAEWGSQHFKYEVYSADAPGANGMTAEDVNVQALLMPTEGEGYYTQGFMAWNAAAWCTTGPIIVIEQTVNDLPAGAYTLTADGCVLEQDENNNWFASNGYNYYAKVDNEAAGYHAEVEFPHYMHEAIANPAGQPTVPPELTTMSVDFVVMEDNQPVRIYFEYSYAGLGAFPQQIYLDNLTLTRTGDKEAIVASINQQTEMTYGPLLQASFDQLGWEFAPEGWEDMVLNYTNPVPAEINTMELATAYQNEIIAFTAHIDSLIEQRGVLQTVIDSALSAETLNYSGLAELQTLRDAAELSLTQAVDLDVIMGHIAALEAEFPEYQLSGITSATEENPVDLTFLIENPGVEGTLNSSEPDCAPGWTISAPVTAQAYLGTGNDFYPDSTDNGTTYFNAWHGTAGAVDYTATQVLSGLPQGVYRLTADMCGDGAGSYVFAQSMGTYFATEMDGTGLFKPYAVDGILVADGTLTIGTTTQGDELWGGTPFANTWFSADNFRLEYVGQDLSGLNDLLANAIAEAEAEVEVAEGAALKGDLAAANEAIAGAKTVAGADPVNVEGIAEYLPQVSAIPGNISTSIEAYNSINDAIAEAQLYQEADSATEAGLEALNTAIAEATAYLAADASVAAEADSVVGVLQTAINGIRVHSEGQDVTFLITNPDQHEGTTGYVMESNNIEWQGVTGSSDYYGVPTDHFCYWQGSLKDDAAFNWYQTLTNIPNGYYRLTVNGLYAAGNLGDGSEVPNDSVVFYAVGDSRYEEQVPFTAYTIAMGGELTAEDSLLKDARTAVYTLDEVMVNDGTLTFGVKNIGFINATTVRWYGYRLTYLGGADEVVPPVGVEETVADEQDFTVYTSNGRIIVEGTEDYVVYTMSGLPVDKDASLPAGIYLVRAGSRTKAIVVD